jgi:hypothetical protein
VDFQQRPFVEGLFCSLSEDANAITFQVEHTPDNPDTFVYYTAVRAGTVLTLTFASPHGLVTGDAVTINNSVLWNGQYTVASTPSTTTLTVTVANSGVTVDQPIARAALCRVFVDAVIASKTAKIYGSNLVPVLASRINNTAWTAGTSYLEIVQGHARG